jgi:phage terminase large subunit-like protein
LEQSWIESLTKPQRQTLKTALTDEEAAALLYEWQRWARPSQLPPKSDWLVWLLLAGRGFGKSRTGAEWVRAEAERDKTARIALVAPTAADVRDVMVEGESGILAISPPWFRPIYEPSKRRLTWPNGAMATTYSADEPDRLRGPQHSKALCDEVASWRYPETWDMLQFGLRLGVKPQTVVTTTPKPTKLIRDLLARKDCHITRGSTYDNRSNLAKPFLEAIVKKYEGTRLGRQELYAEILEDIPGALWSRRSLDENRVDKAPNLIRKVVAVDPPATSGENANECGIVVVGMDEAGRAYVLDDWSAQASPDEWARKVVAAYRLHDADLIVAEVNQGGEMVAQVIRSVLPDAPIKMVRATRGKYIRAEPVSALYEQGRVKHVGSLATLEDQMVGFTPERAADRKDGFSPDRVDALVWGMTELFPDVISSSDERPAQPHVATGWMG